MTEDSAIRIDCVTLQSLCTLPTLWSSSSIQYPGTCPTGSLELVPQEWTRTSPTRPFYRVSLLPYHRHTSQVMPWVSPVSSRHLPSHGPDHRMVHKLCPPCRDLRA